MEVVNAFNPSSERQDQPGLHREFRVSQSYIVRPILRKKQKQNHIEYEYPDDRAITVLSKDVLFLLVNLCSPCASSAPG